jgi:epoxyqueuosine reductase
MCGAVHCSDLAIVGVHTKIPKVNHEKVMAVCEIPTVMAACPTGAISSDRFLLHAERCIVFHNEQPGDVPFPSWMKPSWHNCIVGCMLCQRACPVDGKLLSWIGEKEEFSEEEITLLLKGVPQDKMPATILRKLERLSLIDDLERFPRNLSVFFRRN